MGSRHPSPSSKTKAGGTCSIPASLAGEKWAGLPGYVSDQDQVRLRPDSLATPAKLSKAPAIPSQDLYYKWMPSYQLNGM